MTTARGTFDVTLTPATPELDGVVSRIQLHKLFRGGLEGEGAGVMLSAGDPASGSAGYVAIEVVRGTLDGRPGAMVLAQLGLMVAGSQSLHYEIVPGSGQGELAGVTGSLDLVVDPDGTHRYELRYDL